MDAKYLDEFQDLILRAYQSEDVTFAEAEQLSRMAISVVELRRLLAERGE